MRAQPILKCVLGGVLLAVGGGPALLAHSSSFVINQLLNQSKFKSTIQGYQASSRDLDEIAITPTGDWVMVASGNEVMPWEVIFSDTFPSLCVQKILEFLGQGRAIDVIAFAPNGSFAVIARDLYYVSPGAPEEVLLNEQIAERVGAGNRITELAFTENGKGWALISGDWAYMVSVPQALYDAVVDRHASKRSIQGISIGQRGRWVLEADQWVASSSLSGQILLGIRFWPASKTRLTHLRLGLGDDYVMYSHGTLTPDLSKNINRIEYGLQAGARNIFQRMQETVVKGLSYAVIDGNQVAYARAYGELEASSQRYVLASSPFDVASLAKYVAALGIMRLAQEGLLSLATDAYTIASQGDAGNQLYLWKAFGEGDPGAFDIDPPVPLPSGLTIRRLLSHTASLEPWSSTGITVSAWPPVDPSMFQLLLGFSCGSGGCDFGNGRTVWYNPALGPPGTAYRYSGGGFLVAQAVAERVSGQKFSDLMQQRVLGPLGMADSQYVLRPPSAAFEAIAARQHDSAGTPLERRIYPWASAGGLYASPRDYAQAMIPLMNLGQTTGGAPFLHPFGVFLMLQDATPDTSNYGLGLTLSQSLVGESGGKFSHNGSHSNRAYGFMEGRPDRNQGIVVVVNTESTPARTLVSEVVKAFECAYGWTTSGCL